MNTKYGPRSDSQQVEVWQQLRRWPKAQPETKHDRSRCNVLCLTMITENVHSYYVLDTRLSWGVTESRNPCDPDIPSRQDPKQKPNTVPKFSGFGDVMKMLLYPAATAPAMEFRALHSYLVLELPSHSRYFSTSCLQYLNIVPPLSLDPSYMPKYECTQCRCVEDLTYLLQTSESFPIFTLAPAEEVMSLQCSREVTRSTRHPKQDIARIQTQDESLVESCNNILMTFRAISVVHIHGHGIELLATPRS